MMKRILFVSVLSMVTFWALAQTYEPDPEIGYLVGRDGEAINGYIDLDYQPEKKISSTFSIGDEYTPGAYYDLTGKKHEGWIKFTRKGKYIHFKPSQYDKAKQVTASKCTAVVLAQDSFIVIKDFMVERDIMSVKNSTADFAEVLQRIGDITFYEHIRVGDNSEIVTHLFRKGSDGVLTSIPRPSARFKSIATDLFGHIPYLKEQIDSSKFGSRDVLHMIKYLNYTEKFKNNRKIYYSPSWVEQEDSANHYYYANILSIKGNEWELEYFRKDGGPVCKGMFLSVFPMRKTGEFKFYDKQGNIRRKVIYKDNQIDSLITEYFSNGTIHYQYEDRGRNRRYYRYIVVNDAEGKPLLDERGNGEEIFYDSILNREIHRMYSLGRLKESFFITDNGRKVFQLYNGFTSSAGVLEYRKPAEANLDYPERSIFENSHGLVLVKILADSLGNIEDVKIIYGVDHDCNQMVMLFCKSRLKGKTWTKLKVGSEYYAQEVVMAFEFDLKAFSNQRKFSYFDYNWLNNMMLNLNRVQQIHPIPLPNPGF